MNEPNSVSPRSRSWGQGPMCTVYLEFMGFLGRMLPPLLSPTRTQSLAAWLLSSVWSGLDFIFPIYILFSSQFISSFSIYLVLRVWEELWNQVLVILLWDRPVLSSLFYSQETEAQKASMTHGGSKIMSVLNATALKLLAHGFPHVTTSPTRNQGSGISIKEPHNPNKIGLRKSWSSQIQTVIPNCRIAVFFFFPWK